MKKRAIRIIVILVLIFTMLAASSTVLADHEDFPVSASIESSYIMM